MAKDNTIYGLRTIIEAIDSAKTVDKIFLQKGLRGDLSNELFKRIKQNDISFSFVPSEKLHRLAPGRNHQGAIAVISPITFHTLDDLTSSAIESGQPALFLILDQLSDVRNFGAIVRTAECTGVSGIIIQKKGGAPINADTVKTSAGAIFKIPICKVDHIKDAIFYMQSSGIKVVAATEKAEKLIYDINLNEACAIVMGSEGRGINPSVLKLADEQAKLPILGDIASLNVSVACGAFLYEVTRQRI